MSDVQAFCIVAQLLCVVILLCVISVHLARICNRLSEIRDAIYQLQTQIAFTRPESSRVGFPSKAMSLFSLVRGRAADAN